MKVLKNVSKKKGEKRTSAKVFSFVVLIFIVKESRLKTLSIFKDNIFLISFGMSLLVFLVVVLIKAPRQKTIFYVSSNNDLDPVLEKLLRTFGSDIVSLIQNDKIDKYSKTDRIEKIFNESNNPWHISMQEFYIIRLLLAFAGGIAGLAIFAIFKMMGFDVLGVCLGVLAPLFAYNIPVQYYSSVAHDRSMNFKKNLPEAIDYLVLAISNGGYTLSRAFEIAYEYLEEGIIKDEFGVIVDDLRTGLSMEQTLKRFAERCPTESIKTFCKALINANKQSVPMNEILRARADASRRDLETEIEKRVVNLPTKVNTILSLSSAFTIGLISFSPSLYTMLQML